MRVLLIAGGWSNERQVSLNGAAEIEKALYSLGHEVTLFDLQPDLGLLIKATEDCDAAFINLHGNPGEDGLVQALLEDIKFPYQGSGPVGSFLALDKNLSKQIFRNHGLPTPDWYMLSPEKRDIPEKLSFPCIAKPNSGGSSLGLEILNNKHELEYLLNNTKIPRNEILLEDFIEGTELTCAVLEDKALPPILIKPKKSTYFDYASKYDIDGAQEICPAPVPQELSKELGRLALEAHKVLKLNHYSRTDFILSKDNTLYILETNTLPGMTRTSLVPKAALTAGLEFNKLIQILLDLAESRYSEAKT